MTAQRDFCLGISPGGPDPEYLEQHKEYEKELEAYNKRIHLTTEESIERKRIQKLKLAGRDKIERILSAHRGAQ
jgi:hypothetical protein